MPSHPGVNILNIILQHLEFVRVTLELIFFIILVFIYETRSGFRIEGRCIWKPCEQQNSSICSVDLCWSSSAAAILQLFLMLSVALLCVCNCLYMRIFLYVALHNYLHIHGYMYIYLYKKIFIYIHKLFTFVFRCGEPQPSCSLARDAHTGSNGRETGPHSPLDPWPATAQSKICVFLSTHSNARSGRTRLPLLVQPRFGTKCPIMFSVFQRRSPSNQQTSL